MMVSLSEVVSALDDGVLIMVSSFNKRAYMR